MSDSEFVPIPKVMVETEVQPWIIAQFFSFTLFGIGLLQFWDLYGKLRKSDENHTKDIVILTILLIADIADSVGKAYFLTAWLRKIIIGGFKAALVLPSSVMAPCLTDGLVALFVHTVYARRLWRIIPEKKSIAGGLIFLIMIVSLGQFVGSVIAGHVAQRDYTTWFPVMYYPAGVWFAGAAFCDIMLCGMMVFYLARHRSNSSFEGTSHLLTKYMILSFETGLIPAMIQIIELGLFYGIISSHFHFTLALCEPKIYLNGVLILIQTAIGSRNAGPGRYTGSHSNSGGMGGVLPQNHELQSRAHTPSMDIKNLQKQRGNQSAASGVVISSQMHIVDEEYPAHENTQVVLTVRDEPCGEESFEEKY